MSRPDWPGGSAWLLGCLALLSLVACGGRGVGAGPSAEASPEGLGTARPTARATPAATPSPVDAFLEFLEEPNFTARAEIDGTITVGGAPLAVTGEWTVSGADFSVLLEFGEPVHRVEQALVDGLNYVRTAPMPWMRDPTTRVPRGVHFAGTLAELRWREKPSASAGSVQVIGAGSRMPNAMHLLGVADSTLEAEGATLTVRLDRRGRPTRLDLLAEGHRVEDETVTVEWDFTYWLDDVGDIITVEEPTAWVRHESTRLGYAMHHPEGWEPEEQAATADYPAYDVYLGPIGGEVQVALFTGLDPSAPVNLWYQGVAAGFQEWVGPIEETETLTVAGERALFLAGHGQDANGEWWVMQVSLAVADRAWDITWWSEPGREEADREMFDQFLATFRPIP